MVLVLIACTVPRFDKGGSHVHPPPPPPLAADAGVILTSEESEGGTNSSVYPAWTKAVDPIDFVAENASKARWAMQLAKGSKARSLAC